MAVGKLEISPCSVLVYYYIPEHLRIKTTTGRPRDLRDGRDSLKVFMELVSLGWGME